MDSRLATILQRAESGYPAGFLARCYLPRTGAARKKAGDPIGRFIVRTIHEYLGASTVTVNEASRDVARVLMATALDLLGVARALAPELPDEVELRMPTMAAPAAVSPEAVFQLAASGYHATDLLQYVKSETNPLADAERSEKPDDVLAQTIVQLIQTSLAQNDAEDDPLRAARFGLIEARNKITGVLNALSMGVS